MFYVFAKNFDYLQTFFFWECWISHEKEQFSFIFRESGALLFKLLSLFDRAISKLNYWMAARPGYLLLLQYRKMVKLLRLEPLKVIFVECAKFTAIYYHDSSCVD